MEANSLLSVTSYQTQESPLHTLPNTMASQKGSTNMLLKPVSPY